MREMTKTYEECLEGTAENLVEHFEKNPPRGEIVLLIEACQVDFSGMSPEEHVKAVEKEYGVSKKEAIEIVAKLRQVSKRKIYKSALIAK
jgi:16S rRNA (cytidine1402-2'-O)-methyltransferase